MDTFIFTYSIWMCVCFFPLFFIWKCNCGFSPSFFAICVCWFGRWVELISLFLDHSLFYWRKIPLESDFPPFFSWFFSFAFTSLCVLSWFSFCFSCCVEVHRFFEWNEYIFYTYTHLKLMCATCNWFYWYFLI